MAEIPRPAHIHPLAWERMSWYARQRATRHTPAPTPPAHVTRIDTARPWARVRVFRDAPGRWVVTDGVTTATCATVQTAWRFVSTIKARPA